MPCYQFKVQQFRPRVESFRELTCLPGPGLKFHSMPNVPCDPLHSILQFTKWNSASVLWLYDYCFHSLHLLSAFRGFFKYLSSSRPFWACFKSIAFHASLPFNICFALTPGSSLFDNSFETMIVFDLFGVLSADSIQTFVLFDTPISLTCFCYIS